jgi:hypothetical protein
MSYEIPTEALSLVAAADLRTKQYYGVKLNTSGQIVLAGDGESAIGILQDAPNTTEIGRVMTLGVSFAVAGDAITAGSNVALDAAGKFVTAGGGDAVVGVALKSAAAGDIFSVFLSVKASAGTTGITAGYAWMSFPVNLNKLDNGNVVTGITPGFTGKIDKIEYVCHVPTTDASTVNCSINATIGGVATTGGVLSLNVGASGTDPDTMGKIIAASAITGANDVVAASVINIVVANTANPFTDGSGVILVRFKITA